ncbi:MAG: BTAD domain-containing putative transcriptional regulator [Anaerolineae bacterium]|jgi:DNA-binding SARP family transcriptional activator
MKRLDLHLFGAFQATWDGLPLTGFRSDKARAVLVYLAVEGGRPHRREMLGALLWGERPERSARASLRSVLYNLRQILEPVAAESDPPLLTVTRQSVTFHVDHPDCWVDVVEFDALVAATRLHLHQDLVRCSECVRDMTQLVHLYVGDFVAGLNSIGSPAFDEWRLLQQETRHRQIVEALNALTAHHSTLGRYDQAARYARRQIELAPWREAAHRQLMRALTLGGQRNAALVQYETCRRILRQELDVEPDVETTRLYVQIRNGELRSAGEAGRKPSSSLKGLQPFEETDR